jgi:rubredoxin
LRCIKNASLSSFKIKEYLRKTVMEFKTYMCLICGWVYDEASGLPDEGIAPGTLWKDVPMNWTCPECGARKEDFEMMAI